MSAARTPAVFLDRDGTLIEDQGYPRDAARVRLLPGVSAALRGLRDAGFSLVVVGNQSGIGRGIITEDEARAVHDRFVDLLAEAEIELDGVKYCPHAPWEDCACRKPSPALLLEAADELGIDPAASFMVGDKCSDVEAGRRAGCRTVQFGSDGPACNHADARAGDWTTALEFILHAGALT